MNIASNQKITLFVILLLVLNSCGGGSSDTSSSADISGSTEPTTSPIIVDDNVNVIVGVDHNGDGVRDDVEQKLREYSADDVERLEALIRLASKVQLAMVAGLSNDKAYALEIDGLMAADMVCYSGDADMLINDVALVEMLIVNTQARSEAYINYGQLLSGEVLRTLDTGVNCD